MKLTTLLLIVNLLQVSATGYSQNTRIDLSMKNATIKEVLGAIENQSSFKFVYRDEDIENKTVSLISKGETIDRVLNVLLSNTGNIYRILSNDLVVIAQVNTIQQKVNGKITDSQSNEPLVGVNVTIDGTTIGTISDAEGKFSIDFPGVNALMVFTYIGYTTEKVAFKGQNNLDIKLVPDITSLDEIVVVGYGIQKKESVTGSITGITAKDIGLVHGGATVSSGLAGKIAGVSFRMSDGRPGNSASIQVRNLGPVLYVIDGIQKDEGQFNNISPADIESITVLKDASAAIYGVKAANGVVVITTKHGRLNTRNTIEINALYGWQNWTRFPKVSDAYAYKLGIVNANMNQTGNTSITQAELDKWKAGTDSQYKSFDWYKAIVTPNMPQSQYNINASGGNEDINYYVSLTRYDQDAVISQYKFNRTNFQSNIDARIARNLKIGVAINGRIEERVNPGVPGGDDYWVPRFAILRNSPTDHEFANDNPLYMNDIGHDETNFALMNYATSGKYDDVWHVLQTNFNGEYKLPLKGLTAKGALSYYYADELLNNHEFTYSAYKYDPINNLYNKSGGSQNPWQERLTSKILETVLQGQINYTNIIGKHTIDATFVSERTKRSERFVWVHVVPPLNPLDVMQVSTLTDYNQDRGGRPDNDLARVGYVGRVNYSYDRKYYFEASGRRDASSMFSETNRWGNFYSISGGWRISSEEFYKKRTRLSHILSDLKIRASYGLLGDDNNIGLNPWDFPYINGYSYPTNNPRTSAVFSGQYTPGARDRGIQATNISWTKSKITDFGVDFSLLGDKITGAIDYFYRKRTGIPNSKDYVIVPSEAGFILPRANVGSDAQIGGDMNLAYNLKIKDLFITLGGNWGISRKKNLTLDYNRRFGNSLDYYQNSTINRWDGTTWGLQTIGQFQSQDQISNYKINNDGKGNMTQLPGDLIYKDQNGDGVINQLDLRPIGYSNGQPIINYGFNLSMAWKGIDFHADFSGGFGYTYQRDWEQRQPFQGGGNLATIFANDSWHRADPYDVNSAWVSGKYPALTYDNRGGSNYTGNAGIPSFWLVNVHYLRARTIELGYSIPKISIMSKLKIQKLRLYVNTYNLFSFDNMKLYGIETEISDSNGLQYPQNRIVNLGLNLSF